MSPCTSCEAALNGRCAVRAANQPHVAETFDGHTWTATITVPDAGSILPQHSHAFEHVTEVVQGAVEVFRDGSPDGTRHDAPARLTIPAHTMHTFTTLAPGTILRCIHTFTEAGRPVIAAENGLTFAETA